MVIDDDEEIVILFQSALEFEGFKVQTARNGHDILKRAIAFRPHLVISDLMMPSGGGYELVRSLQSDPTTRRIPVIMITGSHFDSSTQDMIRMESNVVLYLEKPIRPDELVNRVHLVLKTMSAAERRTLEAKKWNVQSNDGF
jgi:two-component system alkaline phosphatase synthesis response regulator PhoP